MSRNAAAAERPNRFGKRKDKKYHLQYGKWATEEMYSPLHRSHINKTLINWNFYKGNQWIFDEDLTNFLLDDSGDYRHRIKLSKNLIRPIVEQWVGNAVRMSFNTKVVSISEFVINRREKELAKVLNLTKIAQNVPEFADTLKQNFPIGDTEEETLEIFENTFTDSYEKHLNALLKSLKDNTRLDELKVRWARHVAMSGMGIYKDFEQNFEYVGEDVNPLFFFWDRSAKKPDLSDASYMGEIMYMDVVSIAERFGKKMKNSDIQALEKYSATSANSINSTIKNFYGIKGDKIPVYETYWVDQELREYAWVKDEADYPVYALINHKDSKYKDKDIVEPPTEGAKEKMRGRKKDKLYLDVLRFSIFVPGEEVGHKEDIMLDFGIVPYQATDRHNPSSVKFPYSVYTWIYENGEVLSPVDDIIDTQRFSNRVLSVTEALINNSGGAGVAIAEQAISDRDKEHQTLADIKKGKPITVDVSRVGSVTNAVHSYDASIPNGIGKYFDIINAMGGSMREITAVNQEMTGNTGASQLVGVTQANMAQGSLVQEPIFFTISQLVLRACESMVNRGRLIYADNPRRLAIFTGDKGVQEIIITKDMALEDFRLKVSRSVDPATERVTVDNQVLQFMGIGLLDRKSAANLLGRASLEELYDEVRVFAKDMEVVEKQQAQMMQQQEQAQQQQMMMMQQQQEQARREDQQMKMMDKEKDIQAEMDKIFARGAVQARNQRIKNQG